ncbi:YgiW/YdeI family stress tolerance OB fold protein [Metapseudomonas otitidis]|uniref:YgiW/YdeI family stress tolerance OB fold protein n=1 Tax=Metapseudomonas otitidis TaxID=319939 RepID=UPI0013F666B6|nr:NirD/YgiW/YdeI family stress tolerance protein [Pseudomonas otitidis]
MKKYVIVGLLGLVSFGAFSANGGFSNHANSYNSGGFIGASQSVTTVEQAKKMPDDAWVTLEGNLVRQVGHELYEFKDATGTVLVDIDNKRWRGQSATPETKVQLIGEVDKDWMEFEVDVKQINIIQ